MDVAIKKTSDINSALEVAESSKEYFKTGFDHLKQDLKNNTLYGAYLNKKMVGFVSFKKVNTDVIEIGWMAIIPKHRSLGIGSKLVKTSLDELKDNYKICEVKTLAETHKDKDYARTRNFYKKLGFVSLEIIHPYPGWDNDSPCQIFIKHLN